MLTSGKYRLVMWSVTLAILVAMTGLWFAGCGGEQQPVPARQAPVKPVVPATQPAPQPAAPAPAPALAPAVPRPAPAFQPVTLDVLKLTPAQAQIALALPPANGTLVKVIALAKRIAPPELDVEAKVAEFAQGLAIQTNVEGAKSLNDIAVAKGVSLDKPVAVFADVTKSVDSAIAAAEKIKAAVAGAAQPAQPSQAPAAGAPPSGAPAPAAAPAAPEWPKVNPKDLEFPSVVAVLGLSDAAKAEAAIKELASGNPILKPGEPVAVGEVKINVYGDYGYFIAGDKLALGSLDLLKGVAERVANPAGLRYGGADCPATAPDEGSVLIYGERLLPLLKKALPAMDLGAEVTPLINVQAAALESMLSSPSGEDPVVTTMAWTKDMFELKSRMDTATHPGLLTYSGPAAPMKYAQMLPEGTVALLNLRLTTEWKKQITDVYLKEATKVSKAPGVAQGVTIGGQVLGMLGEEIALGVAGVKDEAPAIFLMVGLGNPEQTKGLLQMLIPVAPAETYKEVPISQIQVETPIPLWISFPGDMVMFSNNVDKMKAIIDMIKENKTTNLFATFVPPLDPATPRYSSLILNTSLWTDVLMPLDNLLKFLPADVKPIGDQVASILREVRMMSEMDGSWQATRLTLYLKEAV